MILFLGFFGLLFFGMSMHYWGFRSGMNKGINMTLEELNKHMEKLK